jgi:hypothetical protein
MEEDWPAYDIGPKEHIHALGVVSLNYNLFEGALWLIFERYLGIDGLFFFEKLGNSDRVAAMQQILHREPEREVQELIVHLAKFFAICTENRNNLMHAQHNFGARIAERLVVQKRSKRDVPLTFSMRLDTLRQVADQMHAGTSFLIGIDKYLHSRASHDNPNSTETYLKAMPRLPLPDAPKLPRKLEPLGPPKQ